MGWNDGVWDDGVWNGDGVIVVPPPVIEPTPVPGSATVQLGAIVLGSGQPDSNGIVYDWIELPGWFDSADLRSETSEVLSMGVTQTVSRRNGRALSIKGIARAQHVGQKLGNLCYLADRTVKREMELVGKFKVLTVNEPDQSFQAIVTAAQPIRCDFSTFGKAWMIFEVPLLAPDPRRYGTIINVDAQSTVGTGVHTATATLTNDGDLSTPPVFTFLGPLNTLAVKNTSLAGPPSIGIDFGTECVSGSTAILDVVTRTLTLDGVDRPDLFTVAGGTRWFDLAPGDNVVTYKYDGAGAGTVAGVFTAEWRSAWS